MCDRLSLHAAAQGVICVSDLVQQNSHDVRVSGPEFGAAEVDVARVGAR